MIKSIFKTLQGEGYWTGRPAIFIRFTGCNLWTGLESDRADAICKFCDTEFVGGDRMTAQDVAGEAAKLWGNNRDNRFVVLTGGEPTLQVDYDLIATLHRYDFFCAIETNGTRKACPLIDWITVSPKSNTLPLFQDKGDELKLIYPQDGLCPEQFKNGFKHWFIQPMDGTEIITNTREAIQYCLDHPRWRLSLQTHKSIGIS